MDPKTLVKWPPLAAYETRSKVDTCVGYNSKTQSLQSWGFECDEDDPGLEVKKHFKLFLDRSFVDSTGFAPVHKDVQQWFVDYLAALHHYVQRHFADRFPRFAGCCVEWVFSVPTTWKDPGMLAEIERMIKKAGFEKQDCHKISITLTEAEAAAVYVSKQRMRKDDVFLVCDAGGGTTDVNVLKVLSAARGRMQLEPLQWSEGATVGSNLIDEQVEKLLLRQLRMIRDKLDRDVEAIARDMVEGKFQAYKCAFGSSTMDAPDLTMPIPGLPAGENIPYAAVRESHLVLLKYVLLLVSDKVECPLIQA